MTENVLGRGKLPDTFKVSDSDAEGGHHAALDQIHFLFLK